MLAAPFMESIFCRQRLKRPLKISLNPAMSVKRIRDDDAVYVDRAGSRVIDQSLQAIAGGGLKGDRRRIELARRHPSGPARLNRTSFLDRLGAGIHRQVYSYSNGSDQYKNVPGPRPLFLL